MAVTGEIDKNKIWKNSGASIGDLIILTKPLGTGIIASGIKKELVSKKNIDDAVNSMSLLNKYPANILKKFQPSAVTDISGFGLLGHLKEVCENSNVTAEIKFSKLEFLNGVKSLAKSGIIPGGTKRNLEYTQDFCSFDSRLSLIDQYLLADAQTSGGLLIILNSKEANQFLESYNRDCQLIGSIKPKSNKLINII